MGDRTPIVDVVSVRVLSRYVVEVGFADGQAKVIDLEPLLWGDAFAALIADYDLFCAVEVDTDAGTIVWPNGADISPRALYEQGKPAGPQVPA
jgi:hypothetical protein